MYDKSDKDDGGDAGCGCLLLIFLLPVLAVCIGLAVRLLRWTAGI
jgi:hypothetical protein